ncbi:MAG: hypothetical protein M5R36_17175 [Deltaproteobacteria bacterium]|nr:hypothetical protein [Deltaproteobacteria bacterium]
MHRHDDYQLIYVFPMAALGGLGAVALAGCVTAPAANRGSGRGVFALALAGVLLATWTNAQNQVARMARPRAGSLMADGLWLAERTAPRDFIVYLQETYDWNPAYLYYAKRDGFYVATAKDWPHETASAVRRFGTDYNRVWLFCPGDLAPLCPAGAVGGERGTLHELTAELK